ncbi:PadR family transcriptional regulator [Babesia caballi]|uniref:PadR family transcriptional regulator n=1 Tax=Babesia caballi TaxID=5871 RepID=A0AAV4LM93_BABCB|nr:PadR family transcriptional regulator [Babesia caballi]
MVRVLHKSALRAQRLPDGVHEEGDQGGRLGLHDALAVGEYRQEAERVGGDGEVALVAPPAEAAQAQARAHEGQARLREAVAHGGAVVQLEGVLRLQAAPELLELRAGDLGAVCQHNRQLVVDPEVEHVDVGLYGDLQRDRIGRRRVGEHHAGGQRHVGLGRLVRRHHHRGLQGGGRAQPEGVLVELDGLEGNGPGGLVGQGQLEGNLFVLAVEGGDHLQSHLAVGALLVVGQNNLVLAREPERLAEGREQVVLEIRAALRAPELVAKSLEAAIVGRLDVRVADVQQVAVAGGGVRLLLLTHSADGQRVLEGHRPRGEVVHAGDVAEVAQQILNDLLVHRGLPDGGERRHHHLGNDALAVLQQPHVHLGAAADVGAGALVQAPAQHLVDQAAVDAAHHAHLHRRREQAELHRVVLADHGLGHVGQVLGGVGDLRGVLAHDPDKRSLGLDGVEVLAVGAERERLDAEGVGVGAQEVAVDDGALFGEVRHAEAQQVRQHR